MVMMAIMLMILMVMARILYFISEEHTLWGLLHHSPDTSSLHAAILPIQNNSVWSIDFPLAMGYMGIPSVSPTQSCHLQREPCMQLPSSSNHLHRHHSYIFSCVGKALEE